MTFFAAEAGKSHDWTSGQYDLALQREFHREQWNTNVKPKMWRRLARDSRFIYDNPAYYFDDATIKYDKFDSVDYLYQEEVKKRFHRAIPIRCLIVEQAATQELGKLGIVEKRTAVAKFSTVILEDMGFSSRDLCIGDILEYKGHEYTLDTVVEDVESHWLETGIPFVITCNLNTVDRQHE